MKTILVTPCDSEYPQYILVDKIVSIDKIMRKGIKNITMSSDGFEEIYEFEDIGEKTRLKLTTGDYVCVEESMKTINARINSD